MKTLHRFRPSRLTVPLLAGFAAAPAYSMRHDLPGDPGQVGNPASWRTPEFLRSYGLGSMGAESRRTPPATPARQLASAWSIPASTSATLTCPRRASLRSRSAP